jgi:hypothetical protein
MNNEFKSWVETQYNPWKEAMEEYENSKVDVDMIVQKNAAELKYIVALLLEKRESEAVKIWNDLELSPRLRAIELDLAKDKLVLIDTSEVKNELSISTMLEELQFMLDV